MRNYIFILFIFISSSTFLFAQTEDVVVSPEPVYISPTNREASAKARILARLKLKEAYFGNYSSPKKKVRIPLKEARIFHKRAKKKGMEAYDYVPVIYGTKMEYSYHYQRGKEVSYIINQNERDAAYISAYNNEIQWFRDSLGIGKRIVINENLWEEYLYMTIDDLDETIDVLKKRNIEPGHISYFYSNQVMITNEKDIEHHLKNITANNNHSKPLEKYIKNNVSRIYLVVYQWDKGSHIKAFLFTPKGVVFERLYFTNVRNAVNPKTGTTIYVTEEEALIFTKG